MASSGFPIKLTDSFTHLVGGDAHSGISPGIVVVRAIKDADPDGSLLELTAILGERLQNHKP